MDNVPTAPSSTFVRNGYAVIRGLVKPAVHEFLSAYAVNSAKVGQTLEDKQVPNTPVLSRDPLTEALLEMQLPRMEAETGMHLLPTYSYLRVYKRGDILRRHTDRPACEASLTVNLGCEAPRPWPIWLESAGRAQAFELSPGDAVLYRGIELPHWREPFDGERLVQVFLHYVDRDGPNKDWVYDKRARLSSSPAARRILEQLDGSTVRGGSD